MHSTCILTCIYNDNLQDGIEIYLRMLDQLSQKIPSVTVDRIQSHLKVLGHHQDFPPNQSKRIR